MRLRNSKCQMKCQMLGGSGDGTQMQMPNYSNPKTPKPKFQPPRNRKCQPPAVPKSKIPGGKVRSQVDELQAHCAANGLRMPKYSMGKRRFVSASHWQAGIWKFLAGRAGGSGVGICGKGVGDVKGSPWDGAS